VARMGLFGRRTAERDAPTAVGTAPVVDRDGDGVDDRDEKRIADRDESARRDSERLVDRSGDTAVYEGQAHDGRTVDADRNNDGVVSDAEARAAHERTEARLAARQRLAAKERVEERQDARHAAEETRAVPVVDRERVVDRDRDGVDDRVKAPREPKFRARASLIATLALMVGLTSVYAALTGTLAPWAVVLGVLGLLLSFGGLAASGRPRVAGSGLAVLALLLSVGGAVLGVLAMNHVATWLDSDVDQVARLRDWLDAQLPFMSDW
jgi:hypothetical protein